jgi:CubicO group peptidase (beta-lactamase class C family)
MKKNTLPLLLWAGLVRGAATVILLAVLVFAGAYLAQPSTTAASEASAAAPDFAAIDKFVEAEMQALRLPGLALGIVQGDQIVHLKGFGVADPSGRVVTPQTPFIIGSTSKSFTALATMQLVEAGQIELDAPVQQYIPWFRVADETASTQITVRHLLNQTSGFSTVAGRKGLVDFDPSAEALENRVRQFRDVKLTQPVGATFQYSNCNYSTLGLIVQMVSGQSYESYVQQHILDPLDMHNSFTSKEEAQQHGLAMGHHYWFGQPVAYDEPYSPGSIPQGFIISSGEDMAHYLSAQLSEGRYGNTSILSPAGIVELHRPPAEPAEGESAYAMGWEAGSINGTPAVWHGGDTFSFMSFMLLMPAEGWGVVLLANAVNIPETFRFQAIAPDVINLLAGRQPIVEPDRNLLMVYSILLGLVAFQIVGMIRSVVLFRRWRGQPQHRPAGWLGKGWHIGLPFVLNLAWALFILVGIPQLFGPLLALRLGLPDVGYTLVVSSQVALGWGILRTVWGYVALTESDATKTAGTPVTI